MGIAKVDGKLNINDAYTLPDEAGLPGQSLRRSASGDELVWGSSSGIANNATQLVEGAVIWRGALLFEVTVCSYYILGNFYQNSGGIISVSAADETNPRIDVIYADIDGNVGAITGTPAVNPVKPIVDPYTQIELTEVLILAGASTPSGLTTVLVYDENVEWTTSSVIPANTTANFANTLDPKKNSKSILVSRTGTGGVNGSRLIFETNTPIDITDATLVFNIKTSVVWQPGTKNGILIKFIYDNTLIASLPIVSGSYGFNGYAEGWQNVAIPINNALPGTGSNFTIDAIEIVFGEWGSSYTSFSIGLDDIEFQNGVELNLPVEEKDIEEIMFDISHDTSIIGLSKILDLYAYYPYRILGIVSKTNVDSATITVIKNGSAITGLDSLTSVTVINAVDINRDAGVVAIGDLVNLVITLAEGTPTQLIGKLKIQRI